MARKHKPEDIIGKLREAEIVLAQGSRAHLYGQVKSKISFPLTGPHRVVRVAC